MIVVRLGLQLAKIAAFAAIVLVIGQIPVGSQRICDHVRDVVQHTHVQTPIRWVASRFDFLEGHKKAGADYARDSSRAAGSEVNESDRGRLSGLLKRHAH